MLRFAVLFSVGYFAVSVAEAQELTCINPETQDAYISYTGSCMMGERQLIGDELPRQVVDDGRPLHGDRAGRVERRYRDDRPYRDAPSRDDAFRDAPTRDAPFRDEPPVRSVQDQVPRPFTGGELPPLVPVVDAPEHAPLPEIEPHPVPEVVKSTVLPGKDKDAAPADAPIVTAEASEPKSVVKYDTTFYNSYLREAEEQNVLIDATHRRITWHKGYKGAAPQYFYDASLDDLAPQTGSVRGNKKGPIVFLDDTVEKPGNPYYTAYFLYFRCVKNDPCIRERYVENGTERATRQLGERGIGFHSIQDAKRFMEKYLSGPILVAAKEAKTEEPKKESAAGELVLSTQDWAADPGQKLLVASNTSKDKTYVLTSYTLADCHGIISQQCATAKPRTEIEPGRTVSLIVVAPGGTDEYGKTPRLSFSLQWTYEDDAQKEYKGALDAIAPIAAAAERVRVTPGPEKVKGEKPKRKPAPPQDS